MIDSQDIQQLLKKTKVNSLTDIIKFIFQHLHKVINLDPLHDISSRLNQLEKSRGLDFVMIEQVKTIVDAMFEQKQQTLKKDIEKTVHNNISVNLEQEQTRRSLNQLDFMQMLNVQQKPSSVEIKAQTFHRQINELRAQLEKKADRKDMFELRNCVHKDISGKMSLKETERIIEKFQQQFFDKLNENNLKLQKIQSSLRKSINQEFQKLREDLNNNFKSKQYKAIVGKMEKKLKKCIESNNQANEEKQSQINELSRKVQITKTQGYNQFQQLVQLIENINANGNSFGVWVALEQLQKNKAISWTKQYSNTDQQNYKFETKKTQIMVVKPGFYRVECAVEGCQHSPTLMINTEPYEKLASKQLNHRFSDIINLSGNRSCLSLKMQNGNYSIALIKVSKL